MAAFKSDPSRHDAKPEQQATTSSARLARVVQEFEELVAGIEASLLRSLEEDASQSRAPDRESGRRRQEVRRLACRLALSELNTAYSRKQIRDSLWAAEAQGKWAEDQLHLTGGADEDSGLGNVCNGYFRLYSTELFDMLGQPVDLRFGTLRFYTSTAPDSPGLDQESRSTSVELALNSAFYIADSSETLPYHHFNIPDSPSLQNRGILSRRWEDGGTFPEFDSWLLFTFLGNGCLKVEIPIEMCADIYGGALNGRENEEVLFWGVLVEDEAGG
ncbi:uncharacterized protein BDR25DRAFT_301497 [Lindgomyces ingoldianus]|uniref:Uncharacterized protein n=1 Tax=Lindgomyces ingoldianus TaxID=673940 RepID=A0ACB6R7Y3_9PLEO|nr:uncharacterized protein BDR25DRAFT_301497 [Lindgomyces ingoldianus]KAF2474908.1 hypothetical protein BDR25DRAFT_301497 [Lindgomyces ingoldianus]